MDLTCTLLLGILLLLLSTAYGTRVVMAGRVPHARVDAEGESAIVPKSMMEMVYWFAEPVVTACVKLRLTPDSVTYGSLVLGAAAGIAFGSGHFGLGALLATLGAGGDALDGLLARRLGVASVAGEVLDAAVDRYVDFVLIAGIAYFFRGQSIQFVLALASLLAAFMVSYSTAKADALGVSPPRGSMRRAERCVIVIGAAALTPVAYTIGPRAGQIPLILALAGIAAFGNASAVSRIASIRSEMRKRMNAVTLKTPARARFADRPVARAVE